MYAVEYTDEQGVKRMVTTTRVKLTRINAEECVECFWGFDDWTE